MIYTVKPPLLLLRSVKIAEMYSVCRMYNFLVLHLMVRKVTTAP
jgi:hypothetical protein